MASRLDLFRLGWFQQKKLVRKSSSKSWFYPLRKYYYRINSWPPVFNFPKGLALRKYTHSHEWISLYGQTATVGITPYAQDQLGDIVYVELPDVGTKFASEEIFGAIECVKAATDLYSPVSGTVKSVNKILIAKPELINKSPIREGWIMQLEIFNRKEYDRLLTEEEYKHFLEEDHLMIL